MTKLPQILDLRSQLKENSEISNPIGGVRGKRGKSIMAEIENNLDSDVETRKSKKNKAYN